jgi:hypothetical protein
MIGCSRTVEGILVGMIVMVVLVNIFFMFFSVVSSVIVGVSHVALDVAVTFSSHSAWLMPKQYTNSKVYKQDQQEKEKQTTFMTELSVIQALVTLSPKILDFYIRYVNQQLLHGLNIHNLNSFEIMFFFSILRPALELPLWEIRMGWDQLSILLEHICLMHHEFNN